MNLLNKRTVSLTSQCLNVIVEYLVQFINTHKYVGVCDALKLLQILIKGQESSIALTTSESIAQLLAPNSILLRLIKNPEHLEKSASCHYDGYSIVEIKLSALFCLEALLSRYDDLTVVLSDENQLSTLAKILLDILYAAKEDELGHSNYCSLMRSAITSCRYIGYSNKLWCLEHIGELLGICVATILFGLPGFNCTVPQIIQSSHQALKANENDSQLQTTNKKGGKIFKARKPRQTPQNKSPRTIKNVAAGREESSTSFAHSILFDKMCK